MQLKPLLENIIKEEEDKANIDALDKAMASAFAELGAEYKAKSAELKKDVEQADIQVNESVTAITIIGALLAAPKIVELIVKGISKLVNVFKKLYKPNQAKNDQEGMANTIIEFTHKWHKVYINGLKGLLKLTGVFKKAGITQEADQQKAAEAIYYVIVAGLAVYSGVGAVSAFKSAAAGSGHAAGFSLAAFEAAMASIKSSEVATFVGKLGLKS